MTEKGTGAQACGEECIRIEVNIGTSVQRTASRSPPSQRSAGADALSLGTLQSAPLERQLAALCNNFLLNVLLGS